MSDTVDQTLTSPLDFPAKISKWTEFVWVEVPKDINDVAIVDKAKQLPLKPIFVNQSICVYGIELAYASYTGSDWRNQNNTLNSGGWDGWSAGEAWLTCSPSGTLNINQVDCVVVKYEVRCLRGGWKTKIPEAGYVYLDGSDLKDWLTADDSITIGKLTSSGGKAGASSDLIVTEWDTKRLISFSFLPASP